MKPPASSVEIGGRAQAKRIIGQRSMGFHADMQLCQFADADSASSVAGLLRYCRRMVKRTWFDQESILLPRVFCQNSGGCGSSYLVQLLTANGVERVFHEPAPDLNQIGLDHFETPISRKRLIRLLRYTRHHVYIEANNRLFSLSEPLAEAFPNARFIHLHRHGAEAIRSAMSKPNVEEYLQSNPRFRGSLAGPRDAPPFERFCHYWSSMNRRILDDLERLAATRQTTYASLRFHELIAGNLGPLSAFLQVDLPIQSIPPVNAGRVRPQGRFPVYDDWTDEEKTTFATICGSVMTRLGYEF